MENYIFLSLPCISENREMMGLAGSSTFKKHLNRLILWNVGLILFYRYRFLGTVDPFFCFLLILK